MLMLSGQNISTCSLLVHAASVLHWANLCLHFDLVVIHHRIGDTLAAFAFSNPIVKSAGPGHTWQAIVRVSHTAPCCVGTSMPHKKLCWYDPDTLKCLMRHSMQRLHVKGVG